MDDNFINELSKAAPKRPSRAAIQTGLGGSPVDIRDKVHKAADTGHSKKHGRFVQFTMRLEEGDVELIKKWADGFGLPHTAMYRWIVARGLLALEEGEVPEIEYRQVPKVIPPK